MPNKAVYMMLISLIINAHLISQSFCPIQGERGGGCDVRCCLGIYRLHFHTPTFLSGHPASKLLFFKQDFANIFQSAELVFVIQEIRDCSAAGIWSKHEDCLAKYSKEVEQIIFLIYSQSNSLLLRMNCAASWKEI